MRRHARGVSALMVVVLMLVLMIVLVAANTLTRHLSGLDDRTATIAKLARAQEALEAYAASARRLPCPANPATDTGLEVQASASTCTHAAGTLPWKTIGLRRDDGYDDWGYKLSYRVYINNGDGSLTQPNGIDMSQCDLVESSPALAAGRLCATSTDPYKRNTSSALFLANKGLRLVDMGVDATNRAYVIMSHGESAYGAWSSSGVQGTMPLGDELNNLNATGTFTIRAFSDADTAADNAQHFDDLVVYRTVEEVVKRAGLAARDWPEGATLSAAALGFTPAGNNFSFMTTTFRATGGNFNLSTVGGTQGLGITSPDPNFLVTGAFVNVSERIRVELSQDAARAALTLNHFGKLLNSTSLREQVRVRFYNSSNALVGVELFRQGCADDGGLASFVVEPSTPGGLFRNFELEGELVNGGFGLSSSWLLSEVAACNTATCETTLASAANSCMRPSIDAAFAPATIVRPASAVLTYTITNGTDNPAFNGLSFTAALPANLVMADASVTNSCGATVVVPAAGSGGNIVVTNGALGNLAASCTISVNVTASAAGSYVNAASAITASANLINKVTTRTLVVQ